VKAVHYRGSRSFEVVEVPAVAPGPNEVRIRVARVGLCGTDLHVFHGDMDQRVTIPAIIGHEMSGRVESLGEQVAGLTVGQPVTVMPTRYCGECAACRRGHRNVCHRMQFMGIDSPGALQELWSVPAGLVVPLPEGIDLSAAALIEPVTVAVHDVRRSGLAEGDRVVVVGGGPIGLLIALVAQARGAEVVIVEPDEARRAVAGDLGIRAINPAEEAPGAFVEAWTDGAGADVAFEVSGSAGGVATAVEVLTTRGKLIMVAIHSKPREVNLHRFFWRELEMYGARLYDRGDMDSGVQLVADGTIPAAAFISAEVEMADVQSAFEQLGAGGAMKILVKTGEGA
jgi:2-desacetyl-2-hydroxyethyl bacteriochlorophyllide A dehydrogenase